MPVFDSTSFLAHLSSEPGVYCMIGADDTVLYVGKARNLKKRVSSYFSKQNTTAKIRSLVHQISRIDITITRTETEALLLESSLIKSMLPKYNVVLRDDKSYPYIHINTKHPFPRVEMIRCKKKPRKGTYFGPFPSVAAVRDALNTIQKIFKLRNCRDSYFNSRSRPCLQYQIKRCSAPCTNYISEPDYKHALNDAIKFLQGKSQDILADLEMRMQNAVSSLDFEHAAFLRDQIKSLRFVQEQQGIMQLSGDLDAIAIDVQPAFACIQCVTVRDGAVIASASFFPVVPLANIEAPQDLYQKVFEAFVSFYYLDRPERIPRAIIVANALTDTQPFAEVLSQLAHKKCLIVCNPRGSRSRWLDFARNNLQRAIAEHQASAATLAKRYQALNHLLGLSAPIRRMECFDISHTQGQQTVASCVVFTQDGPSKKDYRRYSIEGITPGDDYAAMHQALTRRFKKAREEGVVPDVLIIDGGKGHTAVAGRVLDELTIRNVLLLGIAKGADRKAGWERLVLVAENKEITLNSESPALHLLQHIRDEAHRFAITTHRKKREKAGLQSSLESIEGIGPKKRHALLQRFGGIQDLAKAPIAEITKINGINRALAERIFFHFHPDQKE